MLLVAVHALLLTQEALPPFLAREAGPPVDPAARGLLLLADELPTATTARAARDADAKEPAARALRARLQAIRRRVDARLQKDGRVSAATLPGEPVDYGLPGDAPPAPMGHCAGLFVPLPADLVPRPQNATWQSCGDQPCLALGLSTQVLAPDGVAADFERRLAACAQAAKGAAVVDQIRVDANETAKPEGWFRVACADRRCRVASSSSVGARYGLDTLLRLLGAGAQPSQVVALDVEDWPAHPWRGLMLDVGRRFVPVDGVEKVLDGMFASRLNVLHLHLSDYCRFALSLPAFPELNGTAITPGAPSPGAYSPDDVKHIVQYAADRGVRVVPELDLPGHAQGLTPLEARGLSFCAHKKADVPDGAAKLNDDDQGKTRQVLGALLTEVAKLFPDPVFHLGADEAGKGCSGRSLEEWAVQFLQTLGKRPMAWEDLAKEAPSVLGPQHEDRAEPLVLQAWLNDRPEDLARLAFHGQVSLDVVASPVEHAYLDRGFRENPVHEFYHDIGTPRPGTLGPGPPQSDETPVGTKFTARGPCPEPGTCVELGSVTFYPGKNTYFAEGVQNTLQGSGRFEVSGGTLTLSPREDLLGRRAAKVVLTTRDGRTYAGGGLELSREEHWSMLAQPGEPPASHRARLLGGEVAMWSDEYTDVFQCGAWGSQEPTGAKLWPRAQDAVFLRSLEGMIWPRAGVFAAALWNFDPLADPEALADRHAAVLRARGIESCPPGCFCSQAGSCGTPY